MEVSYPDIKSVFAFFIIIILDLLWFSISLNRVYPKFENTKPLYGLIPWMFIALAVGTARPSNIEEAGIFGLSIGAIVYGTFNGTEAVFRQDWRNPSIMIIDTLWGMTLCMVSSIFSLFLSSLL